MKVRDFIFDSSSSFIAHLPSFLMSVLCALCGLCGDQFRLAILQAKSNVTAVLSATFTVASRKKTPAILSRSATSSVTVSPGRTIFLNVVHPRHDRHAIGVVSHGFRQQYGARLHRRLAQQHARRQWKMRVMSAIPKLVAPELLAADDPAVRLLDDFIDEQKRLAVRDGAFDGFAGHGIRYDPAGAALPVGIADK
jgi:hypothetical protein